MRLLRDRVKAVADERPLLERGCQNRDERHSVTPTAEEHCTGEQERTETIAPLSSLRTPHIGDYDGALGADEITVNIRRTEMTSLTESLPADLELGAERCFKCLPLPTRSERVLAPQWTVLGNEDYIRLCKRPIEGPV